ncbi:MAG: hypothetical protein QMD71_01170 [bacterium]|nr:hypothetical protein [bacterium]
MKKQKKGEVRRIKLGLRNWILILLGVLFILVGYLTLSKGSLTLAPILLVLGYCVLIPVGIFLK